MTRAIQEAVANKGFSFIRQYCPGSETAAVADMLGKPLIPWEGGLVQGLIPRLSATPNTYSGIYGVGCFPFHTDLASWHLPPRYLLLRCVTGYTDVATRLVDGRDLIEAVTLDILTRAIFKPRRPRNGALALLRLCEYSDDGHRLRWDQAFLKPASRIGVIANVRVRDWLDQCQAHSIALARTGDTLLIDNWRMLHARSPIPTDCKDRKIERIYLEDFH